MFAFAQVDAHLWSHSAKRVRPHWCFCMSVLWVKVLTYVRRGTIVVGAFGKCFAHDSYTYQELVKLKLSSHTVSNPTFNNLGT